MKEYLLNYLLLRTRASHVLYYYDQSFTGCHPSPQLFTGYGVQTSTEPVTGLEIVHSANQPAHSRAMPHGLSLRAQELAKGHPKMHGAQQEVKNLQKFVGWQVLRFFVIWCSFEQPLSSEGAVNKSKRVFYTGGDEKQTRSNFETGQSQEIQFYSPLVSLPMDTDSSFKKSEWIGQQGAAGKTESGCNR